MTFFCILLAFLIDLKNILTLNLSVKFSQNTTMNPVLTGRTFLMALLNPEFPARFFHLPELLFSEETSLVKRAWLLPRTQAENPKGEGGELGTSSS